MCNLHLYVCVCKQLKWTHAFYVRERVNMELYVPVGVHFCLPVYVSYVCVRAIYRCTGPGLHGKGTLARGHGRTVRESVCVRVRAVSNANQLLHFRQYSPLSKQLVKYQHPVVPFIKQAPQTGPEDRGAPLRKSDGVKLPGQARLSALSKSAV